MTIMYCWRTGLVGFTDGEMPDGALLISNSKYWLPPKSRVTGEPISMEWREHMQAACRLAYDGKSLLIPGVPEAKDDKDALQAVIKFREWVTPAETIDHVPGRRRRAKHG